MALPRNFGLSINPHSATRVVRNFGRPFESRGSNNPAQPLAIIAASPSFSALRLQAVVTRPHLSSLSTASPLLFRPKSVNSSVSSVTLVFVRYKSKFSRKMPPKKQVEEKKIPLGRPGNNLKSGIVSLPSDDNTKTSFDGASIGWIPQGYGH